MNEVVIAVVAAAAGAATIWYLTNRAKAPCGCHGAGEEAPAGALAVGEPSSTGAGARGCCG